MIDPKAEPIGNRTPYKPVDLRPKWRKPEQSEPNPDTHWRDPMGKWHPYEDQ